MRTTVSIDDDLLGLAKLRAHERGETLSAVIQRAIQHYLSVETRYMPAVPIFTAEGGLVPGIGASTNRGMLDALDKD